MSDRAVVLADLYAGAHLARVGGISGAGQAAAIWSTVSGTSSAPAAGRYQR